MASHGPDEEFTPFRYVRLAFHPEGGKGSRQSDRSERKANALPRFAEATPNEDDEYVE